MSAKVIASHRSALRNQKQGCRIGKNIRLKKPAWLCMRQVYKIEAFGTALALISGRLGKKMFCGASAMCE
jgi:hypothetical protein